MTFIPSFSPEIEADSDLKLQLLRPRNVKGRRQVRSRVPNKTTMERARLSARIDEFVDDAKVGGFMAADGNGGVTRVQLADVSEPVLLHLIDNGTVSNHFDIKEEAKRVRREVSRERGFRDALNRPISAEMVKNHGSQVIILDSSNVVRNEPTTNPSILAQQVDLDKSMTMLRTIAAREQDIQDRARAAKRAEKATASTISFKVTIVG